MTVIPTTSNQPRAWLLAVGLLSLTLAPALLCVANERMHAARGPAWAGSNFDPSYVYLLSSLQLSEGVSPGHTDHPGTPAQAFGAVGLILLHPTSSVAERVEAVIQAPETHHRTIVRLAVGLAALAWFVAGWFFWRTSGSLLVALACQALPFGFGQTYFALAVFTPELFFLTLAGWLGVIAAAATNPARVIRWPFLVSLGLLIGTAVMTKVNWLPLVALLLFAPASWKARGWTLAIAAVAVGSWFLLILPEIARTVDWMSRLATHTGQYGGGGTGLVDWTQLPSRLAILWHSEQMHPWVAGVASFGMIAFLFFGDKSQPFFHSGARILVLLLLGGAGVLMIAAKHPAAHYILPIAASSPAIAFLSITGIATIPSAASRIIVPTTALVLLITTWILGISAFQRWEGRYEEAQRKAADIEFICNQHPNVRVVQYYRGSSLPYALQFGNGYARGRYSNTLREQYPDTVFFNIFNAKFEGFGTWIEPSTFYADPRSALFVGSYDLRNLPNNLTFPQPADRRMHQLEAPDGVFLYQLTAPLCP